MHVAVPEKFVWLAWSSAFLIPWLAAFIAFPAHRRAILWTSLFTTPFGLTEPLFVPEYWNPPSLFDLAQRTGFDIESLIFCFGIGGIGAVSYNILTGKGHGRMRSTARRHASHRFHFWAVAAPFLVFPILYLMDWNPIYPAIVAMALGAVSTMLCRRDLISKTWVGGVLFLIYYLIFLAGLEWLSPGYVERVWNLEALSGILIYGMPIEELLFAVMFGAYWSGVYEHFTWRRVAEIH